MTLLSIKYTRSSLLILDQLALPHTSTYVPILSTSDAFAAIRSMRVRGAPAIAIVAALSLAVELADPLDPGLAAQLATAQDVVGYAVKSLGRLVESRPTAVNLRDAAGKLEGLVRAEAGREGASAQSVRECYVGAAERMLGDDVRDNEAIGRYGAEWLMEREMSGEESDGITVLTHCNTGSLATAGYGTALGVVRSLHAAGVLRRVYYTETRPYNQGARLTGFELIHDGIPATMITDSMAAALLQLKRKPENIRAVIVGADRVAANGDTANKIGTYALAILARHHNVKFLVAAPRTTIDLNTKSGNAIVIEERPPQEMTMMKGLRSREDDGSKGTQTLPQSHTETISIAANGTQAWNPAFDVTPAELIDGVVTEVGVAEKGQDGRFDLESIFKKQEIESSIDGSKKRMPSPSEGP